MATIAREIETEADVEVPTDAPIEPSELDEATHAEAILLYRDSEENIRFAKGLQWKTMGGTLILFVLLVAGSHLIDRQEFFARLCVVVSVVLSAGSIYSISILQSWQNTERQKVDMLIGNFSNLFGRIYNLKSRSEANLHRYVLVSFMAVAILMGNYLAASLLMRLYQN